MSQKNVLMIMTDQMHKNALGSINEQVITPNLDSLAADGTIYSNAYSNNPVCGPFRGNLFTGRYSKDNKVFRNNDPLPGGMPTLADVFNENGFDTSFVGKWHLGGNGNEPIEVSKRGGFKHFIGYQCYNGFWSENKFYDEDNECHTFDGHRTDITTDLAIKGLKVLAKGKDPFLQVIFYQAPHYPEQPSDEIAKMYEDVTMRVSPNYSEVDPYTPTYDPHSPRPYKYCSDHQRYGGNMQKYKCLYNAMVTQIDHGVGRIMDEMKALGIYDDTMIIFSSDHGDMQGAHGLLNKCLPYEESCGIPLIVKGSSRSIEHDAPQESSNLLTKFVETPVSSVDYMTTAMAYVGIEEREELEGRDLMAIAKEPGAFEQDCVYAENYMGNKRWTMIRDHRYKLVVEGDSLNIQQLFDMKSDPYEMRNLKDDHQFESVISGLKKRLESEFLLLT